VVCRSERFGAVRRLARGLLRTRSSLKPCLGRTPTGQ
jgi:hypothetical protein